jgi:hypothetical protein
MSTTTTKSTQATGQGVWLDADAKITKILPCHAGSFASGRGPVAELQIVFQALRAFLTVAVWDPSILAQYIDLGGLRHFEVNLRMLGNRADVRRINGCAFRYEQFQEIAPEAKPREAVVLGRGFLAEERTKEIWSGRSAVKQSFQTKFSNSKNGQSRVDQNVFFWLGDERLGADIKQYTGRLVSLTGRLVDLPIKAAGINEIRVAAELTAIQPVEGDKQL